MNRFFIKVVLLCISTLLFSGTIIGSWKIDQDKTKNQNKKIDPKIVQMTMLFFENIDIYDNHTLLCNKADLVAKWYKQGDHYIVIDDEKKRFLYMINDENIKLIIPTLNGSHSTLFYRRVLSKKRHRSMNISW